LHLPNTAQVAISGGDMGIYLQYFLINGDRFFRFPQGWIAIITVINAIEGVFWYITGDSYSYRNSVQ
jgi:hypothetical protein